MMRAVHTEDAIKYYVSTYGMARFLNDDLRRHLELFRFPAYANIYIEQDEQHYLYFLVDGQVQCSQYHLSGKLAVFALATPFSAIGDLEILSDVRLTSNVIAMQPTVMLGLASPVVQQYGANDPRFLRFLIDELQKKLYEKNAQQANLVMPVINRLAVYMLSQVADEGADAVTLPGKEELASLLSTTVRHLNRVLRELAEAELIGTGYPRVKLRDRAGIEALIHRT